MISGQYTFQTTVRLKAKYRPSGSGAATPYQTGEGIVQLVSVGTGSGYADQFIERRIVIPAASSVTLDLFTGTDLKNIENLTAPLAAVKNATIWVATDTGDSSGVRIGGAASNAWLANFGDTSDMATIYPDGPPWCAGSPAGLTVSSTSKNLKLENLGAAAATVHIKIAGSSSSSGMLLGILGMTYP